MIRKRSPHLSDHQSTPQKSLAGKQRHHHHHHHHYHHRRRRNNQRHDHPPTPHLHRHHHHDCPRRNRSNTDLSNNSINTCHSCTDQEVREILIKKPCCSASKTEIVQYFVEDLYGTSGRASCCTTSDYCYHTDSTSLYGSKSSLSRSNSIKSASAATMRRKRSTHHRHQSYGSVSLGRLNGGHGSHPNSMIGSLTSIFDKTHDTGSGKMIVSPSKVTIEHQSKEGSICGGCGGTGSGTGTGSTERSKDLPEYAYSPSPIRWSFLADGESKTPSEIGGTGTGTGSGSGPFDSQFIESLEKESYRSSHLKHQQQQQQQLQHQYPEIPSKSSSTTTSRTNTLTTTTDYEESNTVIFHQEGEAVNNCCNNYLQCNAFLDQDLQITSEDICGYLSKGKAAGEVLNNSIINYPFQPSNALEFQYRNNFSISSNNNNSNINNITNNSNNINNNNNYINNSNINNSLSSPADNRRRTCSKETNLNNHHNNAESLPATDSPLSLTNINLSSSSNNINIIFNSYLESNANEVKFINTSREAESSTVLSGSGEGISHSTYHPYVYPSYDYTNMSSNSLFEKPIGIDEIPPSIGGGQTAAADAEATTSSTTNESGSGVIQQGGCLSHSNSTYCQNYNSYAMMAGPSTSTTLSSGSGTTSFGATGATSTSGPNAVAFVENLETSSSSHNLLYYRYSYRDGQLVQENASFEQLTPIESSAVHRSHRWHVTDTFKFGSALRLVRKRARKCARYLRKK